MSNLVRSILAVVIVSLMLSAAVITPSAPVQPSHGLTAHLTHHDVACLAHDKIADHAASFSTAQTRIPHGACSSCGGSGRCWPCWGSGRSGSYACGMCSGTGRCYYCNGSGVM